MYLIFDAVADADINTFCFEYGDCESSRIACLVVPIADGNCELINEPDGLYDTLNHCDNEHDR